MPRKNNGGTNRGGSNNGGNSRASSGGSSGGARSAAVTTARTAASSGSFNRSNAQDLRAAGVNRTKIQDLRSQSRAINQRNTTAAAASTGNQNINAAIDSQFNGGLNVGRDFYNSPGFQETLNQNLNADGTRMSEAQVAKYAMDKGYGLGDKYMAEFGTVPTKIRNPNKNAKNWTNYDYGNTFGMGDLKNILESGGSYAANKAMKIAQGAYAGGDVKNVNKLNKKLGSLNQDWINPQQVYRQDMTGGGGSYSIYPNNPWGSERGRKAPNKLFEWGGFGNGLTQYNKKGIPGLFDGGYEKSQQWSLPTRWMNGLGPAEGTEPYKPWATPSEGGTGNTGNASNNGSIPTELPPEPDAPDMNQSGMGAETNSGATGYRSHKRNRSKAGRGAQGYGSMTIAPRNAAGVGLN